MRLTLTTRASRILLAILLLAAGLRVGFLCKNWTNLDLAPSYLLHAEVARNILNGHWFEKNQPYLQQYISDCQREGRLIDPQDYPPPQHEDLVPLYNDEGGYGLFLAALWKIFGAHRWWYARVLQVIVDIVMCWLVFRIGQKAFSERVGLLAAFLYACFVPGIEMAVRPHRDIWVTFLFIVTVYQLVSMQERPAWWRLLLIGVSAGVVAWMRSTVVPFVLFAAVFLFLLRPWREATRYSLILLTGFALVFSSLIVRNYIVFDKFMATRGAFWHSFWAGVGQMPNPYGLREDDEEVTKFASRLDSTVQFETERYEQALKKEALSFVSRDPLWYVASVAKRATVVVFPKIGRAVFFQETLPQHVSGTLNKSLSTALLLVVDGTLGGLFLFGIWLRRKRWKELLVVMFPYLYTLLTLAPFYVAGRNIANVYFVVLMLAAVSLAHFWSLYQREQNAN